jgi:hypothetical protein
MSSAPTGIGPLYGLLLLGSLALSPASAWGQRVPDNPPVISTRERFSGQILFGGGTLAATPTVHYQELSLRPGMQATWPSADGRIPQLPLKGKGGYLLFELRSGKLATVINGNRQERAQGEIWIIGPQDRIILETADDSVVVQTIQLSGP